MFILGKERRRVRVCVQDGPTIEGVMEARTRSTYVLHAPKVLTGDEREPTVEVTGHIEIPRERVLYFQVIAS